MPTSFLDLPTEIRLEIYSLLFAPVESSPPNIQVLHRRGSGWHVYSRSGGGNEHEEQNTIANILRVSRKIYTEALPVLCKALPAGGPTLAIQCADEPLHRSCTWEEFHGLLGYAKCDARKTMPIVLRGVRRMGLGLGVEVVVPNSGEEQVYIIGLLRWVRALVNDAAVGDKRMDLLEDLAVTRAREDRRIKAIAFSYFAWRSNAPRYPSGLWQVLGGWKCEAMRAEYRFYGVQKSGKIEA
jgi:hypothetical protein